METAKQSQRAQKQVIKKWAQSECKQHMGEAPFWEIIVFSHTWRSNIKAETRGTYTGKLSQHLYNSISYFSTFLCILLFGFPICIRIQSVPWRIWEKQIYKKQEWILPLSILLPKNRFLHRPSISKKQTICKQHINDTSNIQRTTFANNNLSEDPEKTNLSTVKMM